MKSLRTLNWKRDRPPQDVAVLVFQIPWARTRGSMFQDSDVLSSPDFTQLFKDFTSVFTVAIVGLYYLIFLMKPRYLNKIEWIIKLHGKNFTLNLILEMFQIGWFRIFDEWNRRGGDGKFSWNCFFSWIVSFERWMHFELLTPLKDYAFINLNYCQFPSLNSIFIQTGSKAKSNLVQCSHWDGLKIWSWNVQSYQICIFLKIFNHIWWFIGK